MAVATVRRADVIAFRFHRHQLDRAPSSLATTDVDLLDIGVQDTGVQGSAWALEVRGAEPVDQDDLLLAWTIRGAPHVYRRRDVAAITVATAPLSEADAASRVFDAAKSLRENGIPVLEALKTVAREMRDIARRPVSKGEMSTKLTDRLSEPFLRFCRPCDATHPYEQTFRLAALQAGLELEPETSPPVLRRIPGVRAAPYARLGTEANERVDVIRGYLRFFAPASVKAIATFLDAASVDIKENLTEEATEVTIEGLDPKPKRFVLAGDLDALNGASDRATSGVLRMVGSHDPYLQLRDRDILVAEADRQKDLWRILGRPGAIVIDGEVAGTWRPKTSGKNLSLQVEPWTPIKGKMRRALGEEAERLAAHRGLTLRAVEDA